MLEERGVPSVALGSVRPQMEKTRPPRGLWSSAQLGRPVGEPEDKAFQRRVVLAALRLLERTDGPVILEDFRTIRRDCRIRGLVGARAAGADRDAECAGCLGGIIRWRSGRVRQRSPANRFPTVQLTKLSSSRSVQAIA